MKAVQTVAAAVAVAADADTSYDQLIIDFFKQHPDPHDVDIHELAGQCGIEPEELEKHIYRLFTDMLQGQQVAKVETAKQIDTVSLDQMPNMAIVECLQKINAKLRGKVYAVFDGAGQSNMFELRGAKLEDFANGLTLMGWKVTRDSQEVLLARKLGVEFSLIHLDY